jgi:hypothetical protein
MVFSKYGDLRSRDRSFPELHCVWSLFSLFVTLCCERQDDREPVFFIGS